MRYRLRTLLIALALGPVLLALFWIGVINPIGGAALRLYEAQKRSDEQELQTVSPLP